MTLQQKLLAKKSKKGFTLVELVVVIAILAILAAIAIPMVVNIIQSASTSSGDTQASELTSNCKSVYASVQSGAITTATKDNAGNACSWAAAPNATATAKKTAADGVTVQNVMDYAGLNFDVSTDYWYCDSTATNAGVARGDIKFSDTGAAPTQYTGATFKQVTATLDMKTLMG